MLIVNPIYDIVFKYLMEDTEIARQLIAKILDVEILEIEPKPQEIVSKLPTFALNVYRFDFRALIKMTDEKGKEIKKKVLIELQKAQKEDDLVRFRKYLGENYATHDEEYKDKNGEIKRIHYPIITIYFLGFNLANIKTTILRVGRECYDVTNAKKLTVHHKFVDLLTHTAYIIQIGRLKEPLKSDLERILNVFNQNYVLPSNKYILNYPVEADKVQNELFQKMLFRLGNATADAKFLKEIELVEEMENELLAWIRKSQENEEKVVLLAEQLEAEKAKLADEKAKAAKVEQDLAEKDALIQELLKKLNL